SVRVKKITGGHVKFVKRDDVRLVIREPEKPKATVLDKSPSGPNATAQAKAKAEKSGKPEKQNLALSLETFERGDVTIRRGKKLTTNPKPAKAAKPKAAKKAKRGAGKKNLPPSNVHFDVARIVRLYDKGK